MRRWWALLAGLLTGSLVGCLSGQPVRSTAWLDRLRPFHGPSGTDVVQLDVAVLECPAGDPFLNQELWTYADEQVVDLEHRAILEDNGFRIGQVGAPPPAGLQALLDSNRSCAEARRIQLHANHPVPVMLGPAVALCRFAIHQNNQTAPVKLNDARCLLQVVPSLTEDGHMCLHITPQIQHGTSKLLPEPAPDHSGWILQDQQPTETYPALAWDMTLGANQYVVVGTRAERTGTLGHRCFFQGEGPQQRQRLVVIYPARKDAPSETEDMAGAAEDDGAFSRSPPLACCASWTTARGRAP